MIPRDIRPLQDLQWNDLEWETLALPINLAFFYFSSPTGKIIALYPSAAGATESLLPLATWQSLAAREPALALMEPDVEALLVNRLGAQRETYLVPIDVCFELVGLIRVHWRGLSGGTEVWEGIEKFFERLRSGETWNSEARHA